MLFLAPFSIAFDGRCYGINHVLVTNGFWEKIDGACLHCFDAHRNIAMTGHENGRDLNARPRKLGLNVEPAATRQSDVEHETTWNLRKRALQQGCCRFEHFDSQANRSEEPMQSRRERLVVLYN
jgi:hypothetical protein